MEDLPSENLEIGRILHLKSESRNSRNLRLDCAVRPFSKSRPRRGNPLGDDGSFIAFAAHSNPDCGEVLQRLRAVETEDVLVPEALQDFARKRCSSTGIRGISHLASGRAGQLLEAFANLQADRKSVA